MRSCSNFRVFFEVSRECIFERKTPVLAFIFFADILDFTEDLNLGIKEKRMNEGGGSA